MSAAANQPFRSSRDMGARIELSKVLGRHLHRLQRASHVVADHAKQEVSTLLDLCAEMPDRLGYRLIDRLIEANDILKTLRAGLARPPRAAAHSAVLLATGSLRTHAVDPHPKMPTFHERQIDLSYLRRKIPKTAANEDREFS